LLLLGARPGPDDFEAIALTPEAVIERAESVRHLPLPERLEAITEPWVGLPYLLGGLGEGGGPDPQPVTRYDSFDCLTFIEEAVALAISPMPERAHEVRMALRYRDGEPWTYENRRHFMLAEWIPGTVAEGWMRDITADLTGAEPRTKTVTAQTWAGWSRRGLFPALSDERLPVGTLDFHVLPIDQAEAALDEIPAGALVFTVRALWDHLPIAISHVGLTISEGRMRHASAMGDKVVRDDDLGWYVRHVQTYSNWPTEGLIVLVPREYGPTPGHLASVSPAAESAGSTSP